MLVLELIVAIVAGLAVTVSGQIYAECAEGATRDGCTAVNRICLSTDGVEDCGNCATGYIEFRARDRGCLFIDTLPWQEYLDALDESPEYADPNKYTNEQRLVFLYAVLQFISEWQSTIPPPSFELAANLFSADAPEEYEQLLGFRVDETFVGELGRFRPVRRMMMRGLQTNESIPETVDWVANGGVTIIANQGRCGSCWAFSCMGAVEGATFITQGFLQRMSMQQLLSCDKRNSGCQGGNIVTAMHYAWTNRFDGLASDNDYPYTDSEGTTTQQCLMPEKNLTAIIDNPVVVLDYSDDLSAQERLDMMKLAVARQPVSVALKSNCRTFQNYGGGIMDNDGDCFCELTSCIDHAVVMVGYDETSNPPSFKLKNSWGSGWGEGGYFRIAQSGGGRWGLFGMLGQGVIPLEAYNITGQQDDINNYDSQQLDWWQILLIVLAALVGVCAIGVIVKCLFCRGK